MKTGLVKKLIEKHLVPEEEYIYGFANLTCTIDQKFGEFKYGISIGRRLNNKIVNGVMGGPTLEYYGHYRQVNTELSDLIQRIAVDLKQAGINSRLTEPTVTTEQLDTVYSGNLRTEISHKMVATQAGLGWIGKSDLFISRAFGPRLRLVTLLTDTRLEPDLQPIVESKCGNCKICRERCPAGAINGKLWNISVDRDEFFDAFKCREKCKEFGEKYLKMNVRVCGICVAVCPYGW